MKKVVINLRKGQIKFGCIKTRNSNGSFWSFWFIL